MTKTSPRIALVDYGAGNLRSVAKALERTGLDVQVTGDAGAVRAADGVVLPGVGAFKDSMESLVDAGLVDAVKEAIVARRPYLGLCLGLQLLFEEGDEHGVNQGLGVLRGRVEHFADKDADGTRLRVPHIGWNEVRFSGEHPMLAALPERDHFYFVHSYRAVPGDTRDVVGRTDYGGEFASAVAREGLFAVQFHPEKSQAAGARLLEAYRDWVVQA
ncbi:MAG: imidazole glycerol phosphate synthase subunit HisH [Deltaproteobacteria bacterium]|nr:imidazole glycerol phosphate synthase subunit HisH [Deltaproteobacteria bacterium]MBW2417139.1 imidazole glycerol phosphate synthase subunit HisH [Deltaproteobacteria bacterium]